MSLIMELHVHVHYYSRALCVFINLSQLERTMISIEQHINHYLKSRCQFARSQEAASFSSLGEEITMTTLPRSSSRDELQALPMLGGNRQLQWCSTDYLKEGIQNIYICKAYPSILLHNAMPIPIYSIHDKVEPFGCKSDLDQCGEFYLDTTVIHNNGTSITIEAGWYSANLVKHLANGLNMPT